MSLLRAIMEAKKSAARTSEKGSTAEESSSNTEPPLFHSGKQEALQDDVLILQALLRRNRCNHGRAKYYQRLSMALTAIKRSQVLDLYSRAKSLKQEIFETLKRKEAQRKRQQVFWEIKPTYSANNGKAVEDTEKESQKSQLVALRNTLEALPLILGRLEYAAAALWVEIARGFFIPFCVTAVSAVARVRWFVRQAGLWILLATDDSSSTSLSTSMHQEDDQWRTMERVWQAAHDDDADNKESLLWPRREREKLRDNLLSCSKDLPGGSTSTTTTSTIMTSARGASSSTRLTLQRLGLDATMIEYGGNKSGSISATMGNGSAVDDINTSISGTSDDGDDDGDDDAEEEARIKSDDMGNDSNDQHDTGVAVGGHAFMARAAAGEEFALETMDGGADQDDEGSDNVAHQEFDQNLALVKEFQKSRSSTKKKKDSNDDGGGGGGVPKKQRKRAAGSNPESMDKSKKKKKKEKKRKKGDFFDKLFG